ncbi:hypothetical protein RAS1_26730 [Phycisphaerae bacterium RAS1]|nr:hypothetical protein RAS1_26730 [Phycisphaerae bacterium RAS1]
MLGMAFSGISGPQRNWSLAAMVIGILETGAIIYFSSMT